MCGNRITSDNSRYCNKCGSELPVVSSTPATSDEIVSSPKLEQKIPIQSSQPSYRENTGSRKIIEEKSPLLALFCSLIIPGLGQVYNGKTARGIGIFLGSLFGLILIIPGIIVWIYGMYDAYSMAKKMNSGEIEFLPTKTAHLILFVILAIIIGIIGIVFIAGMYAGFGTATTNSQFSGLSVDQIKNQAQNIPYTDLMHSP
jgi:TM2 domain-containing membrane protein YozV